jgi:hypothetical protein
MNDSGKEVEEILKYCRGVASIEAEELKKIGRAIAKSIIIYLYA